MNLHDTLILIEFFVILLSPCVSATMVTMRWDKAEAAYLLFEEQVARLMEPKAKPVPGNLMIRPYEAWAFHCAAAPMESATEFRLRVFNPRKPRAVAAEHEIVTAVAQISSVQVAAA
ncbi:MAG: hypothetical protein PW792_16635 [Acidobacteriaceae bacterium]|nr:hypothetical protein [Acidobacteriaceae bacterium]